MGWLARRKYRSAWQKQVASRCASFSLVPGKGRGGGGRARVSLLPLPGPCAVPTGSYVNLPRFPHCSIREKPRLDPGFFPRRRLCGPAEVRVGVRLPLRERKRKEREEGPAILSSPSAAKAPSCLLSCPQGPPRRSDCLLPSRKPMAATRFPILLPASFRYACSCCATCCSSCLLFGFLPLFWNWHFPILVRLFLDFLCAEQSC